MNEVQQKIQSTVESSKLIAATRLTNKFMQHCIAQTKAHMFLKEYGKADIWIEAAKTLDNMLKQLEDHTVD